MQQKDVSTVYRSRAYTQIQKLPFAVGVMWPGSPRGLSRSGFARVGAILQPRSSLGIEGNGKCFIRLGQEIWGFSSLGDKRQSVDHLTHRAKVGVGRSLAFMTLDFMKRRTFFFQSGAVGSLIGVYLGACSFTQNGTFTKSVGISSMKIESTAFEANGLIPPQYTCDHQDISPPLSWDHPPAGTQSLALICDDPDAPVGTFVHWVLYDLPADIRQLPEGVPADPKPAFGGVHGKNDFRKLGYGGPCPPIGTHRYFFQLYALDQPVNLEPGATKAQVLTAMEGHILAQAKLIGRYARQN